VQLVFIEILSLFATLFSVLTHRVELSLREPDAKISRIMKLLWLWLFTQVIVDFYQNANKFEAFKSFSSILMLISLLYCAKIYLVNNVHALNAFFLGYLLSCIPSYFLFPTDYARDQPWKFCFGINVTILIFWLQQKYRVPVWASLASNLTLVAVDLFYNARSLALLTFISILFVTFSKTKLIKHPVILIFLVIIICFFGEKLFFKYAIEGKFGQEVQSKTIMQTQSGPIFLVARSELLYEIASIKSSWLIGNGSNPTVGTEVLNNVWKIESELGINSKSTAAFSQFGKTERLPQHSMLFTAWVEGGILSALVWFYFLKIVITWLVGRNELHQFTYALPFMLVSIVWAILFSPLGTGSRLALIMTLTLGIVSSLEVKERVS
jgi:hypothetical protein